MKNTNNESSKCEVCKKTKSSNHFDYSKYLGRFSKACNECMERHGGFNTASNHKKCSRCGGPPTVRDMEWNNGKLSRNGKTGEYLCDDCFSDPYPERTLDDVFSEKSFISSSGSMEGV